MAAAFFNEIADPGLARAIPAGTTPARQVHAEVVTAMREVGIDLSTATPRLLTSELAAGARLLVTMGCGEECPLLPGVERQDWQVEDPGGQAPARVRQIRDDVRRGITELVGKRGWARTPR